MATGAAPLRWSAGLLAAWLLPAVGAAAGVSPSPSPGADAGPAGDPAAVFDPMFERTFEREGLQAMAMGVIDRGRVVYQRSSGSREGGPVDAHTRFDIASNSKAMTAALLARLVQQGRLHWDDPVRRHLPGFAMHDPWVGAQLQVRDLLIHNSGLGLGAGDLMLWPEPNHYTRADILAGLAHLKPVSSFRSRYAYDNLLYVVAGEVAAAAGGQPYEDLMREQVFAPLGLQGCAVSAQTSAAAGGIRCTLPDMLRWMQVLLDPARVPGWLDSTQRQQLWTLHMPMPLGARQRRWENAHFLGYGYGWRLSDMDGQWKVAHTGTLSGRYSSLALLPDAGTGVVILIDGQGERARTALMQTALKHFTAPHEEPSVDAYLDELRADDATARADHPHAADSTAQAPPAPTGALAAWQGRYRDPWLGTASLCANAGSLRLQVDKSPRLQGSVHVLDGRWRVDWDSLEPSARVWLQPVRDNGVAQLRLQPIDPSIDFSYDFQDVALQRIGDCAAPAATGDARARR